MRPTIGQLSVSVAWRKRLLLAACCASGTVSAARAEPYNLACTDEDGDSMMLLTVRDAWSPYLAPTFRVETSTVGETSAVTVLDYTGDKIKVEAPTTIGDGGRNFDATIVATIDRNTGIATFQFHWRRPAATKDGAHFENVSADVAGQGHCVKERPKF